MHTNILKPQQFLMVDEKGNQMELEGTIEFDEVDCNSPYELDPCKNTSVTQMKSTFNFKSDVKLTRKKLIKLLMSKGIGRNGANEIAKYILKNNGRYTIFDLMRW